MLKETSFMISDFIRKIISEILRVAPTIIAILKKTVILISKIVCAIAPIVWKMIKGMALSMIQIVQTIKGVVNQQCKIQ